MTDAQSRAMIRAAHQYGDRLTVEPQARTVTTLQGRTESGYIVWGRAHGGDLIGCIFPTRHDANQAIQAI